MGFLTVEGELVHTSALSRATREYAAWTEEQVAALTPAPLLWTTELAFLLRPLERESVPEAVERVLVDAAMEVDASETVLGEALDVVWRGR